MYMTPTVTSWSKASPVRPSNSIAWPLVGQAGERERVLDLGLLGAVEDRASRSGRRACSLLREADSTSSSVSLSSSFAMSSSPSKIFLMCSRIALASRTSRRACPGAARRERAAPQPRWVSRICPTFMRDGTPSGLSTMSTGVPSCEVRHVLFRQDARDDALVAVASGHLVADLELALDGDVDLHHLDDARRQLVALGEAIDLVAEVLLAERDDLLELAAASCAIVLGALDRQLRPVLARDLVERRLVDDLRPSARRTLPLSSTSLPVVVLPTSCLLDLAVERVAEDLRSPRRACVSRRIASRGPRSPWRARPSRCPCGRRPWR